MIPERKVAKIKILPNEPKDDRGLEEAVDFIEWLMIWYCKKPSAFLANLIVTNLESLKDRNVNGEVVDSNWSCDRLLKNWEYIAERCRNRV